MTLRARLFGFCLALASAAAAGRHAAGLLAGGIVVGSRAVQVAEDGPEALRAYVATLRAALDLLG